MVATRVLLGNKLSYLCNFVWYKAILQGVAKAEVQLCLKLVCAVSLGLNALASVHVFLH